MRISWLGAATVLAVAASAFSPTLVQSQTSRMLVAGPRLISAGYFDPNYPRSENRQHLGIDFLAPVGSSVYSPVEGIVITDNTGASDVMQAYLIIRTPLGIEHVLGHIASIVRVGAHVKAGQQVGIVRPWPGQPRRSHVHWGMNRIGVAQAIRGDWGWGRAPVTAVKADAEARGWMSP